MVKKLTMTIYGNPKTKKNNSRIITNHKTGRPMVIPSRAYKEYEFECGKQLVGKGLHIDYPVNLKAVYYRKDRRRVDLSNLHEALQDILVKYDVLSDDNFTVVVAHDGSRVEIDKENPRTEIEITAYE